jgi:hypothetical protein
MIRLPALVLALAASAALFPASAQEPSTIRIEPRPFYGATVTLEEGVRVFRPLPAHKQVIINPGGQTPLQLGLYSERITSTNYNYNQDVPTAAVPGESYGFGGFAADGFRRRHDRLHHRFLHHRFGRPHRAH